jgi:tetratricopeptide (TPR) repeat protein
VEGFSQNLKKTKRMRYYKYEKEPLYSIRDFVNSLLNHIRDKNKLVRKIKSTPRNSFLHFQLGVLYVELSQSSAIPYFKAAIKLKKQYYEAYLRLAAIYENMMDWDRAEVLWEKMVTIYPQDYRPFFKVAHMRLLRGDFSGAENWYHEGLRKKLYKDNFKIFRKIIEEKVVNIPKLRDRREVALRKVMKLKETLKSTPNDTDVIDEISKIYYEDLQDIRMVEMWSNKQLYYDDTDYRAYLRLYKIHKKLGDNRVAMNNLIWAIYEGPSKIREVYLNDLKNIVEKTLLLDSTNGKAKVSELVDYFSMYYN